MESKKSECSKESPVETVVMMPKNSTVANGVVVETAASPLMAGTPSQQCNHYEPTEDFIYIDEKEPADDWCLNSIAATLCFFPLGLMALYFSILTRRANREGNRLSAKKWSLWAHLFGIAGGIVGILIMAALLVLKYKYDYM